MECSSQAWNERDIRRGRFFLAWAVGCVGFALSLQMGLNANFVADVLHLTGFQLGVLEGIRESCGILALGVLALLAGLSEPVVAFGMLALMGLGLGGYSFVSTYGWLIVTNVVWSQGFHVWVPLPQSMAMAMAEPGRAGFRLGQLGRAGSTGCLLGLLAAFALDRLNVGMRPMYTLAGIAAVVGGAACLRIPRGIRTDGPRLVLRRRYGLYYILCFLEGWRKQIFVCFAGFLLVKEYGTPLDTMLVLWIVTRVVGCAAAPAAGRLIDRVGEKKVLVFYFTSLMFFFTGYAFIKNRLALYGLFVVDNTFFVFGAALRTYVNRIAPAAERTPTLSMGVAINHVAAVTMPLVGGFLWRALGYQWAFMTGALAAGLSVGFALLVPPRFSIDEAGAATAADPAADGSRAAR